MGTHRMTLSAPTPAQRVGSGSIPIMIVFGLFVAGGAILLALPMAAETGRTPPLDALFTAVSAICVTGLVVADTNAQYSTFGEAVILVLIQIGGLGYMLGTSLLLWVLGGRLGMRDRQMLRLYYGAPTIGQAVQFVRMIAFYALIVELAGIVVLFLGFLALDIPPGRSAWWAVFHAVSAFNVAGFSITTADITPFRDDAIILLPLAFLAIAGSIGTVPVIVAIRNLQVRRLPLDAQLIIYGTAGLLAGSTLFFLTSEWTNSGTLGDAPFYQRPVIAFFQVSMWTAGLSAIDNGMLRDQTTFFLTGIMFIGGAAGSAAGGIKIGTTILLVMAIVATIRGRSEVTVSKRRIPTVVVRRALAFALSFVAFIFLEAVALMMVSDLPFIDVLFESASAIGTVGWSAGITAEFGSAGRLILIIGMLVGRFAPLLLILEMTYPRAQPIYRLPEEGIHLG